MLLRMLYPNLMMGHFSLASSVWCVRLYIIILPIYIWNCNREIIGIHRLLEAFPDSMVDLKHMIWVSDHFFDGILLFLIYLLQVDIAYIPFIERYQPFLSEVKNFDITIGRPKLAMWIEVHQSLSLLMIFWIFWFRAKRNSKAFPNLSYNSMNFVGDEQHRSIQTNATRTQRARRELQKAFLDGYFLELY